MYALYVEGMDTDAREKFDLQLFEPTTGASPDAVDDYYVAQELAQFRSLSREVGA